MTREEAIDILKCDISADKEGIEYCHDEVGIEALDMAIKALEQEPTTLQQIIKKHNMVNLAYDEMSDFERDILKYAEQEPTDDYFRKMAGVVISQLRTDRDRLEDKLAELEQEPKTGHWEWLTEDKYRCSNCNHETRVDECLNEPMYDFCPFCGEKMVEPQESEE